MKRLRKTSARLGFWLVRPDGRRFYESELVRSPVDTENSGGWGSISHAVAGAGEDPRFGHSFLVKVTDPPAGCWELVVYYRDHSSASGEGIPALGELLSTPVEVRAWYREARSSERFGSGLLPRGSSPAIADLGRGRLHLDRADRSLRTAHHRRDWRRELFGATMC